MPSYEVNIEGHGVYQIDAADDAAAHKAAHYIQEQAAAGNHDLQGAETAGYIVNRDEPITTATGAGLRGLTGGATFNFGDELSSAANAVIPGLAALDRATGIAGDQRSMYESSGFGDAFAHNMREQAALSAADKTEHSTAHAIGETAGVLLGASKLGKLLSAGTAAVAPRLAIPLAARYEAAALARPVATAAGSGAATGAATGAASGFGAGDTLQGRLKAAKLGGFSGAALGGAGSAALTGLAPAVARYASVLLGKGSEKEAVQQIIQSLQRDGYDVRTPTGVQALRAELSRYTGKPVSLADVGSATRARAGVGLRAPSAAQQQSIDQVYARAAGQGQRLTGDITDTVAPRTDVHALDDALAAQRAETALPLKESALYQRVVTPPELPALPAPVQEAPDAGLRRALATTQSVASVKPMDENFMSALAAKAAQPPVPAVAEAAGPPAPIIQDRVPRPVTDDVLNNLINTHPLGQKALAGGIQLSQSERALKQILGQPVDDAPEVLAGQPLDYRTADSVKRYLDQQVNALYSRGGSDTFTLAQADQVKQLRNAIRDRMKSTNPDYAQYLDAYAGHSDMIDALAAGRGYSKMDPEQITAEQGARSQAAQELYRVGVARDLVDTVKGTRDTANPASRILNSPESRAQLAATGVSPENVQRLTNAVQQERTLNLLPAELGGSQTAQRVAAASDADAGVAASLPFNPTHPAGYVGAALRALLNKTSTARNAKVNESLLPRLLETDPQAIENTISLLQKQGSAASAEKLRRAAAARVLGAITGAAIGGPVAIPQADQ